MKIKVVKKAEGHRTDMYCPFMIDIEPDPFKIDIDPDVTK